MQSLKYLEMQACTFYGVDGTLLGITTAFKSVFMEASSSEGWLEHALGGRSRHSCCATQHAMSVNIAAT